LFKDELEIGGWKGGEKAEKKLDVVKIHTTRDTSSTAIT